MISASRASHSEGRTLAENEEKSPSSESLTPSAAQPVALSVEENPSPELPPLTPIDAKPKGTSAKGSKGKRKRGRPPKYATAEQKAAARNQREKDKRELEAAQRAAEEAAGISSPAKQPGMSSPDPITGTVEAVEQPEPMTTAQLAIMLGLAVDLGARFIPPQYGGGALTADERAILGEAWAPVAAQYMGDSGVNSPLVIASITTVQVFAMRAFAQMEQPAAIPATPSTPQPPVPAKPQPEPPAAATPPTPPKAANKAGTPAKKVKLPQYTGAD